MHEWRGGSLMLGVRRGFVDKISSGSGRVHHSDRYRRFSPERRRYSDIFSRRRNSMDFEERPIPVREYRGHYRRDSGSHGLFFFCLRQMNLFLASFIRHHYHQFPISCFRYKPQIWKNTSREQSQGSIC
jgi:hypothetical protein